MINDNVTEMLDLGPMPKRRGRPATGQAMSAAEKQRLYRQRIKERHVTENQEETITDLKAQIELLKRQLATVIESSNVTGKYWVEMKYPRKKWESLSEPFDSKEKAERFVEMLKAKPSGIEGEEFRITLR